MSKIIFNFCNEEVQLFCTTKEKLKDVFNRFAQQVEKDLNKLCFLYNGNIINQELSFENGANEEDKNRNTMNILVDEIYKTKNDSFEKSKDIICPICNENTQIKIEDYRINLNNCKNGHKLDNILLKDFENTQLLNMSKIKCDICKKNNKSNTYKNIMYKCLNCDKNLCPLCKTNHENKHNIILYELKSYICNLHNETFISYCEKCKKNLCLKCEIDHKNHGNIIFFGDLLADNRKTVELFKEKIDIFKNDINDMISKLENIKDNIDNYYKIYNDYLQNNNSQYRNYITLINMKEFINFNNSIFEDINEVVEDNNLVNKLNKLLHLYFIINKSNYIISEIDIKSTGKKRIINSFEQCKRENIILNGEDSYGDLNNNEKEIKENCIIKINNKVIPFSYFYNFEKNGIYKIQYIFIKNLKNTNFLFSNCDLLKKIDLSNFNTQSTFNMCNMFNKCISLININFSNFKTNNVNNMISMFKDCESLKEINVSTFNTQKVTKMSYMFYQCKSLTNLDLSNFDNKNVKSMYCMFYGCQSLTNLDLSNFNTQNTTDIYYILDKCNNLKKENIKTNDKKILDLYKSICLIY